MAISKAISFGTEPVLPVQDNSELKPNHGAGAEEVILTSSSISEHDDSGGDPYNSTGQYVFLEANGAERTKKET